MSKDEKELKDNKENKDSKKRSNTPPLPKTPEQKGTVSGKSSIPLPSLPPLPTAKPAPIKVATKDPNDILDEFEKARSEKIKREFTEEDFGVRNVFGENVLHVAIKQNNVSAVDAILKAHINPYIKTNARRNAFDLIDAKTDPLIKEMLQDYKNKLSNQKTESYYERMLSNIIAETRGRARKGVYNITLEGHKRAFHDTEVYMLIQEFKEHEPQRYYLMMNAANRIVKMDDHKMEPYYVKKAGQFFAKGKESALAKSMDEDESAFKWRKKHDHKQKMERLRLEREAAIEMGERSTFMFVQLEATEVEYQKQKYEFINTKMNLVEQGTNIASVGMSPTREVIIVTKDDEKKIFDQWEKFYAEAKKEHEEPIEPAKVLLMVNEFTRSSLKKVLPQHKRQTEQVEELSQKNLAAGKKIRLPNENYDRPLVNASEYLENKCGVCRHHTLINGIIMGNLIKRGILPEGEVRQMRDDAIDDTKNQRLGAHAVITYIPRTGGIWVLDSLNFKRPFPIEHAVKLVGVDKRYSDKFKMFVGSKFYDSFAERLTPADNVKNKGWFKK